MFENNLQIHVHAPHALGALEARKDLEQILPVFGQTQQLPTMVIFNFDGVDHTNGSYLRASLLWSVLCGRADVMGTPSGSSEAWAIRPFPFFPVISNCSRDVAEEIRDFATQRGESFLLMDRWEKREIESAQILGPLDLFLASTLEMVCSQGEITAQRLHTLSTEKITINAWSNRLLELFSKRLVQRRREGKFWIYSSISKTHRLWD